MVERLFLAGADAFRINMSHGEHTDHARLIALVRDLEGRLNRPMTVLADLQGPKLRVGRMAGSGATLEVGQVYRFDRSDILGDSSRVCLAHPEVYSAVQAGSALLLDDGRIRLRVVSASNDVIEAHVESGGKLISGKGVNLPDVVIPTRTLTDKDRRDLDFALDNGVDWIALSFVQRPEDVAEVRRVVGSSAAVLAKIEKPAAVERLDEILALSDAVMVARGDLGVELRAEEVPPIQKKIVQAARRAGKPVVVATQMLESMIASPTPTRAEVSDVANAIYDGADSIMLSAESATGAYPVEAVAMMDAIAREVEAAIDYHSRVHFIETDPEPTSADALAEAAGQIAITVSAKALVCFTVSGSTARRASRERILIPLLLLTPSLSTARRSGLVWGVHAVKTRDVGSFEEMVAKARRMALRTKLAVEGDMIIIIAGVPFGTPGSTNVLHIARITGTELGDHRKRPT